MVEYVALLRGIAPMNPNMSNANLRDVCESLGLGNVSTLLSSGNVLFETDTVDVAGLEGTLEAAWPERLGFESTTIIRSREELQDLAEREPFGDLEHGARSYLLVTFSKNDLALDFDLPDLPPDRDYRIVGGSTREVFSVTDMTTARTPDVMTWIERTYGKQVTSRTWLTVSRILAKMTR